MHKLLKKNRDLFAMNDKDLGGIDKLKMRINTDRFLSKKPISHAKKTTR